MMKDFSAVDQVILQHMEEGFFPSCVVSIFDKDQTLYRKAYA